MTRNVRTRVEVPVVLRQHVNIVKDEAVEVRVTTHHHKRCVHQRRLVEHGRRRLHTAHTQLHSIIHTHSTRIILAVSLT